MKEIRIPLANGNTIVCGEGTKYRWGGYMILKARNGKELLYYDLEEYKNEPESVIGAFFNRCSEK